MVVAAVVVHLTLRGSCLCPLCTQSMARMLDSDSSIVYFYSHYGHGTYFLDRIEGKERYVRVLALHRPACTVHPGGPMP